MSADATLARTAAWGIDSTAMVSPGRVGAAEFQNVRAGAELHRLAGLLACAASSGQLAIEPNDMELLQVLEESWHRHGLKMERLLLQVARVFQETGVTNRVFKGSALAHTVHENPSHRVFADLDILVPGDQLALARRTLVSELGGDDVFPELRPRFDAEFAKDVVVRVENAEIDLHRTLAAGPFGLRIPVDELFEDPEVFELGGVKVQTLPPVQTFLQVCYNAALGDVPPRLLSLRDVAQVHYAYDPPLQTVLDTADRWGGTAVVARAVALSWDTLALEPCQLSRWAAGYSPSALDARLLAASISERRSYTRQVASLAAIKGFRARSRYLRAIISPSDEYLEARGWTRGSHLRRAWNRLSPW